MRKAIGSTMVVAALCGFASHAMAAQARPAVPAPADSTKGRWAIPPATLYMVDGREVPAAEVKDLSPSSIETVNILKGQAAVDVYGEKGRPGVVEITTKGAKPAPPKPSPAFSASHMKAVEELLHVLGQDSLMKNAEPMMAAMGDQVSAIPGLVDTMKEFYEKYLKWDDLKADLIPIYAAAFTESEVRELIVFYRSPVGMKYVAATPDVSAKFMRVIQRRLEPHMDELTQIMMRRASP